MKDNFEHFNLEDLFKDVLIPLETPLLLLDQPDSETTLAWTSVNPKFSQVLRKTCDQISANTQKDGQLNKQMDIQAETQMDVWPYIQLDIQRNMLASIDTLTQTHTKQGVQEDTSPCTDPLDPLDHDFFFDDVINAGYKQDGGLGSCYGDGEMLKGEENPVWDEVSALFEKYGIYGGIHVNKNHANSNFNGLKYNNDIVGKKDGMVDGGLGGVVREGGIVNVIKPETDFMEDLISYTNFNIHNDGINNYVMSDEINSNLIILNHDNSLNNTIMNDKLDDSINNSNNNNNLVIINNNSNTNSDIINNNSNNVDICDNTYDTNMDGGMESVAYRWTVVDQDFQNNPSTAPVIINPSIFKLNNVEVFKDLANDLKVLSNIATINTTNLGDNTSTLTTSVINENNEMTFSEIEQSNNFEITNSTCNNNPTNNNTCNNNTTNNTTTNNNNNNTNNTATNNSFNTNNNITTNNNTNNLHTFKTLNKEVLRGIKRKIVSVKTEVEELSDNGERKQYLEKRNKNNQSVRKSREKTRRHNEEVEQRVGLLVEENVSLRRKVAEMESEVGILKRLLTEVMMKK